MKEIAIEAEIKSDEECVSELKGESARNSGSMAVLEEKGEILTLQAAVGHLAAMIIACMDRNVL